MRRDLACGLRSGGPARAADRARHVCRRRRTADTGSGQHRRAGRATRHENDRYVRRPGGDQAGDRSCAGQSDRRASLDCSPTAPNPWSDSGRHWHLASSATTVAARSVRGRFMLDFVRQMQGSTEPEATVLACCIQCKAGSAMRPGATLLTSDARTRRVLASSARARQPGRAYRRGRKVATERLFGSCLTR